MKRAIAILANAFILCSHGAATTRISCVSSTEEIVGALSNLSNSPTDNDSDEIRIRVGTYLSPPGGWVGSVSNNHDLAIRGGYTDATCSQKANNAADTILDGNRLSSILTINTPTFPNSAIEVSELTFQNGNGTGTSLVDYVAGGLKIGDPGPIGVGRILVERNIFRNNRGNGQNSSGGVIAATDGQSLVVRNNLFVNNSSPNTAALFVFSNSSIDVSNNTFIGNASTDTALSKRVAIDFFTFTGLTLSNNLFWGNSTESGSYDIDLGGQFVAASLVHNDIQRSTGFPISEVGTLSVAPEFVSNGSFHLAPASPLIDAGFNEPSGGLSRFDIDGAPRVDATAVDIGAYESSYIFMNSFES